MQVHALEAALSDVLGSPGVVGAALVDGVTGLTYRACGDHPLLGAGSGPELAELAALIEERLCAAGAGDGLEGIVVTSTRHHEVTRVLHGHGDPLLLVTVLDRERTNLALAVHQSAVQARDLLA
ncbi:hypothetical protein ACIRBX_02975 [Kitasatospora sp. NPDC096147]|uniref:hypothetical protein n=1 Tax=Kitasatospora sp. NPDC096147 TaxID=3364093 RepID=UPI0038151814